MTNPFSLTPLERKKWEQKYISESVSSIHDSPLGTSIKNIVDVINKLIQPRYRTAVPLQFLIADDPQVNACALPYSTIVINRGLIEVIKPTWDELAFVIAHEASHIFRLHTVDRVFIDILRQVLPLDTIHMAALTVASRRFVNYFVEYDADQNAAIYMRRCGFDASAGQRLLSKLKRDGLGFWNSLIQGTHPRIDDRIKRLQKLLPFLDRKFITD
jgi:Zn-dependent protease with chaperone function